MNLLLGKCYFCGNTGGLSVRLYWYTNWRESKWKKSCRSCEKLHHAGTLTLPRGKR